MPLKSLTSKPRIDLLLPAKERFTAHNAGAISGVVNDLVIASTSSDCYNVFGHAVEVPLPGVSFTGLHPQAKWLYGQNIGFARAYLDHIKQHGSPDLIEVHSRCLVAAYLMKKRSDIPVILYLHNDPREMRGTKSASVRHRLLTKLASVICISDYIRNCYLDGLEEMDDFVTLSAKVGVARNGARRWLKAPALKQPIILLVGRMVPEKGILECATALAALLPAYPEWRLVIAGARRFEEAPPGSYDAQIAAAIAPLGAQAEMLGFIPLDQIRQWQGRAAVAACPSLWDEPLGKVVLESLAAGCALLTTRRGGIPEIAEGRALIIDTPSVATFTSGFDKLLGNDDYRRQLQKIAWNDFPFTDSLMAQQADDLRKTALRTGLISNRI